MSVVIPAHNSQDELVHTLAALAHQTYPQELMEVVIADDRSERPIELPELRPRDVRVIRADGTGHGSGVARDLGARAASGDVLLFLDSDIITDPRHVDAHVRWHESLQDAVVLGTRDFVDVDGATLEDTLAAVRASDLTTFLPDRQRTPHEWIDKIFVGTDDLTNDRDDLWRPIVGASVSVRRDFYAELGGFAHFTRWGIVDIEFGYRAFTAGGVIIPEREAYSIHQGPRTAALRGPELTRLRAPLIANHIAHRRYRPPLPGRRWSVPESRVVVDARGGSFRQMQGTVEDLLAGTYTDLVVDLVVGDQDADQALDYWGADSRVAITGELPSSGFPSPYTVAVAVGTRADRDALARLVRELRGWSAGLVTVETGAEQDVEAWATRALLRSRRALGDYGTLRAAVRDLFGETVLAGERIGLGTTTGVSESFLRHDLFFPAGSETPLEAPTGESEAVRS